MVAAPPFHIPSSSALFHANANTLSLSKYFFFIVGPFCAGHCLQPSLERALGLEKLGIIDGRSRSILLFRSHDDNRTHSGPLSIQVCGHLANAKNLAIPNSMNVGQGGGALRFGGWVH